MIQTHNTRQESRPERIEESIEDKLCEWLRKAGDFLVEVKSAGEFLAKYRAKVTNGPNCLCTGFYRALQVFGLYDPRTRSSKIAKKMLRIRARLEKVIKGQNDLLQAIEKERVALQRCNDAYRQHYDNSRALLDETNKKYKAICEVLAKPGPSMLANSLAEFLNPGKAKLEQSIELLNEKLARINAAVSKTGEKISGYKILTRVINRDVEYSLQVIGKFDEIRQNLKVGHYEPAKQVQPKSYAEVLQQSMAFPKVS